MKNIEVEDLLVEASLRLEVGEMARELEKKAGRLYPGARVRIEVPEESDRPANGATLDVVKFEELAYLNQIQFILKENKAAMAVEALFTALKTRGSRIPKETLNSYLSRNKKIFFRVRRGEWTLQEFRTVTAGQQH